MRPKTSDRALCLHEAAHAVMAEVLRPGCVLGIEMDYLPGTPDFLGVVHGGDIEAVCNWTWWYSGDPHLFTVIAAGREGEKLVEGYGFRHDDGDRKVLRFHASPLARRTARRRAASLVRRHELAVRRLAKALAERRTMTGDEIRAVIA